MSNNWNIYVTTINNKLASFFLDLDPWQNGANDGLDHLYRLSVMLNEPNEDGQITQEETPVLYAIEDSIHDSLDSNYMFVGRMTTDGRRDFYYYTESIDGSELEHLAAKFLVNYQYTINRVDEQKPREFYYSSLYPQESDRHRMANRQLVDKLRELGDDLTKPRIVTHWIYFGSAESRNLFVEKVQQEGFQQIESKVTEEGQYSTVISRNEMVQLRSIDGVTDYLISVAQEYQGEYDGWEAKVIQEQQGFLGGLKKIFKSKK